jgi:WD40 repeat protein
VAVSPDGTRIVTASADNTARVWDASTFAEIAILRAHTNSVRSVAVSPDGKRIVTGSRDNTVRVWEVFPVGQALINNAKARVPRCLTTEQRQLYHIAPAAPRWCETLQKWPYDPVTQAAEAKRRAAPR